VSVSDTEIIKALEQSENPQYFSYEATYEVVKDIIMNPEKYPLDYKKMRKQIEEEE